MATTPVAIPTTPQVETPAPQQPQPSTPPVVSTPSVTPQQEARAALYQRYYETQGPQPTEPVAPAPEPTPVEPVAAVAISEPQPTPDSSQQQQQQQQQLLSVVQALQAQVEALQSRLAPPPAAPAAAAAAAQPSWVELLRQGDIEGFQTALVREVKANVTPDILRSSVSEAVERMRAENELSSFVQEVRTKNPELAPVEDYIAREVEISLAAAQAAGRVKSVSDSVSLYKQATTAAVEKARKLVQTLRAAGRDEALTTRTQVLSATTIPPSTIDQSRGAAPQPSAPEQESLEAYIARRRGESLTSRGLGYST